MAKGGNRKRGSRKGDSSSDEEETTTTTTATKDLDFAARREVQRKAAAEKRRSKLRCHVCGETGHVRRECPGIADDGRGESKYTKKKGDAGATHLKNKGRKHESSNESAQAGGDLHLPAGFEQEQEDPFVFYDASCDIAATLEYLQSGRGAKNKQPYKNAVAEYQQALLLAESSTNFGGLVSRSVLKQGRPWVTPLEIRTKAFFVVGLNRDFLYNDDEAACAVAVAALLESANQTTNKIVGFYSDLDYTSTTKAGCHVDCQLRRLRCTCQAAGEAGLSLQILLRTDANDNTISDLEPILQETTASYPALQVLLIWSQSPSSTSENMLALLQNNTNIWIGMDASVGFAKAKHLHESAFDVPLSKLVLLSGQPSTTPPQIGQRRDVFCHSGHIPHVAQAVAECKRGGVTAESVARQAAANTLLLYPGLGAVVEPGEEES